MLTQVEVHCPGGKRSRAINVLLAEAATVFDTLRKVDSSTEEYSELFKRWLQLRKEINTLNDPASPIPD